MTIQQILAESAHQLEEYSDSPRLDAELLLAFVLKSNRAQLLTDSRQGVSKAQLLKYQGLIKQRRAHAPIGYLLGRVEFFGLSLQVTSDVLIPRPFTETLVEHVIHMIPKDSSTTIADIGTGSGAIALALAAQLPRAKIIGTDISRPALAVAKYNAKKLAFTTRIQWKYGSLLTPLSSRNSPEIVIANLPYLTQRQLQEPSIRHEPKLALYGGRAGLGLMLQLITQVKSFPSITMIALEFDPPQLQSLRTALRQWSSRVKVNTVSDGRKVRALIASRL